MIVIGVAFLLFSYGPVVCRRLAIPWDLSPLRCSLNDHNYTHLSLVLQGRKPIVSCGIYLPPTHSGAKAL